MEVTTTKELSRFQKRLNQIDANNFHRSGDYTESASEGLHRRVSAPITKVLKKVFMKKLIVCVVLLMKHKMKILYHVT